MNSMNTDILNVVEGALFFTRSFCGLEIRLIGIKQFMYDNVRLFWSHRGKLGVVIKSLKNALAYLIEAQEKKHLMFDNDDNFGSLFFLCF